MDFFPPFNHVYRKWLLVHPFNIVWSPFMLLALVWPFHFSHHRRHTSHQWRCGAALTRFHCFASIHPRFRPLPPSSSNKQQDDKNHPIFSFSSPRAHQTPLVLGFNLKILQISLLWIFFSLPQSSTLLSAHFSWILRMLVRSYQKSLCFSVRMKNWSKVMWNQSLSWKGEKNRSDLTTKRTRRKSKIHHHFLRWIEICCSQRKIHAIWQRITLWPWQARQKS